MSIRLASFAAALTLLLPLTSEAAVYRVPTDAELIRRADAAIVGEVVATHGRFNLDRQIETVSTIRVESVLKGNVQAGELVEVADLGGRVGTEIMGISDGVMNSIGERVVLFLDLRDDGMWTTWGMALGKFTRVGDAHGAMLVRGGVGIEIVGFDESGKRHHEVDRRESEFLGFVRNVVAGHPEAGLEGVTAAPQAQSERHLPVETNTHFPPSAYMQLPLFRWSTFDAGGSVTFRTTGTQPGLDGAGAAQRALAAWTNDPNSNVRYLYGGGGGGTFGQDGVNSIVFNSPGNVPAGFIAFSAWWAEGNDHTYKSETFHTISEADVVTGSSSSYPTQTVFDEAVAHELGHTLGFRHSDQGTPTSNDAVMKAFLNGTFGANLRSWDIDAVRHVYTAPAAPSTFDANGDGATTVNDVFYLINFLFSSGPAPQGPSDANGDGATTVADIFYVINYLFSGGPPPA